MKISQTSFVAILVIGAAVLAGSSASAGGCHSGGHSHHSHHNHNYHPHHHHHVRYIEPVRLVYSKCYHPHFSGCYVFPGDNWYSISRRVYGVDFLCKHIASYNGLSMFSPLVPGQMLRLPVVNANGSLAVSNAPMAASFAPQGIPFTAQSAQLGPQTPAFAPQATQIGPQGLPNGPAPQGTPAGFAPQSTPNDGTNAAAIAPQRPSTAPPETNVAAPNVEPAATVTPAANIRTVKEEPTLPRVAIGSTLMLDGESLGDEKGIVRLRISTLALPVEVIEWTTGSVKIELPKMELGRSMKASLEVLRADGSLASKSEIELTAAATRLALGN